MKLLIYPAIDADRLEHVCDAAGGMRVVNASSLDEALTEIADADGFFGRLTPELLAASQQLRWVQTPTASLEHYLFDELVAHPCQLTNMRGLFSDVIADHVMGLVLCFARNLHLYRDRQGQHEWLPVGSERPGETLMAGPGHVTAIDRQHLHLSDCTLGVIGAGAIGTEILRRATAFGMNLCAVDAHPRQADFPLPEVWSTDRLDELLGRSRFVVIAAPETPETRGLIDAGRLKVMRSDGYLINIGRGAIVSLAALTEALQTGRIAGAALDVAETEPLPAEHPLWEMPNVLITPHVAAASPRVAERHLQVLLENVRRFAGGEALLNCVDKSRWY